MSANAGLGQKMLFLNGHLLDFLTDNVKARIFYTP